MAKVSPMMIVAVIVIAVVVMSPQIFAGFGNLIDKGWEKWQDAWGEISGTSAGNTTGYSGAANIGYTIYYTDGSTKEFKQEPNPFNLTPLIITDVSGKEIARILIRLYAMIQTDIKISSYSLDITQHIELYKKPETTPKTSSTAHYVKSGSSWPTGYPVQYDTSLPASDIDDVAKQYGDGDYLLQTTASMDVVVSFENGKTDSATGIAPASGIDFIYKSGEITSFTVTINTIPIFS